MGAFRVVASELVEVFVRVTFFVQRWVIRSQTVGGCIEGQQECAFFVALHPWKGLEPISLYFLGSERTNDSVGEESIDLFIGESTRAYVLAMLFR